MFDFSFFWLEIEDGKSLTPLDGNEVGLVSGRSSSSGVWIGVGIGVALVLLLLIIFALLKMLVPLSFFFMISLS